MSRESWRPVVIALIWLILIIGGCSAPPPGGIEATPTRRLFFGRDTVEPLATHIGRYPWPSAPGPLETVEESFFFEYYRDFQGPAAAERNGPYRHFRSYTVGSTSR